MAIQDEIERFEEIINEISELNREALDIVKTVFGRSSRHYNAAKSYWYAHIEGNSTGEEYGGSMVNMPETLQALEEEAEAEE